MKDIFCVCVDEKTFDKLNSKESEYLIVLADNDHKKYEVDNILTISATESFKAKIVSMLFFQSIGELVDMIGKQKCAFKPSDDKSKIEDYFSKLYGAEKIERYGFVAIKIDKV